MWIDAHCHLDLPAFAQDREEALERARRAGVGGCVLAGIEPAGFAGQRALAARHPGLAWTAGLHPCWVPAVPLADALAALPAALAGPHAACAIGEIGLDARPAHAPHLEAQRAAFRAQLAVARAADRPVVLHIVRAHPEALALLRADGLPPAGGMVHSYSGSAELLAEYLGLGLHVSFAGGVADPRARRPRQAAARAPMDRLLVETDAPDQPLPAGPSRNEPAQLPGVLAALASLRGEPLEALGAATAANARRLFRLPRGFGLAT